jgi:rRNA-processing protein EBP2
MDGMHEKLEDIGWTGEAAWDETLMISTEAPTHVDNVDDDLARELAFYNQASSPVAIGFGLMLRY